MSKEQKKNAVEYRVLNISDYSNIISLWQEVVGVCLREADSKEGVGKYLQRNPNLSFVAENEGIIVGTIMSGHDGKRGYIQHLAIDEKYRNAGVASTLLNKCLASLKKEGIIKLHIHVLCGNESAKEFWKNKGWHKRNDIEVFSYINGGGKNT